MVLKTNLVWAFNEAINPYPLNKKQPILVPCFDCPQMHDVYHRFCDSPMSSKPKLNKQLPCYELISG